ncbi:MAG: hypothetical protein A2042_05545 [Candidatus Schekmanbacteria bacterium GWA2_38_11]|uniref:Uncharacterized protein n=1 Tax=Candidatus Schekmanbacteria bacterium GWA2_38_11 TaxID=1817876 RepID=A0A1F7RIE2_9BACT|nr:MAG: hypothetical protein A2042_05545 [Candidatus Schekmanbacteria bacterium GWA2_38_11]
MEKRIIRRSIRRTKSLKLKSRIKFVENIFNPFVSKSLKRIQGFEDSRILVLSNPPLIKGEGGI